LAVMPAVSTAQSTPRVHGAVAWNNSAAMLNPEQNWPFGVDANGFVFVPVPTRNVVVVLSPVGTVIDSLHSEAGRPSAAVVDRHNRIWVRTDIGASYVVHTWEPPTAQKDRPQRFTVTMPARSGATVLPNFDRFGNVVDRGLGTDRSTALLTMRRVVDSASRVVDRRIIEDMRPDSAALRAVSRTGDLVRPGARYFDQPFGARALAAEGPGGLSVEAWGGAYRVRWYDASAQLLRIITSKRVAPQLDSAEQRIAAVELQRIARETKRPEAELPFGIPKRKAALHSIHFDREGRLWVTRNVASGARIEADVYSPSGELVYTAVWPAADEVAFFGGARGNTAWAYLRSGSTTSIARVDFR